MIFRNIAFRRRLTWTEFLVSIVVGLSAGYYSFKPGLKQAKEELERREALKEIQNRRKLEKENGSILFCTHRRKLFG